MLDSIMNLPDKYKYGGLFMQILPDIINKPAKMSDDILKFFNLPKPD